MSFFLIQEEELKRQQQEQFALLQELEEKRQSLEFQLEEAQLCRQRLQGALHMSSGMSVQETPPPQEMVSEPSPDVGFRLEFKVFDNNASCLLKLVSLYCIVHTGNSFITGKLLYCVFEW